MQSMLTMFRATTVLLAFAVAACTSAGTQTAGPMRGTGATLGGDRSAGAEAFAVNCATCHGANGDGGKVGPSLHGESQRMDYGGLVSWIEDPQPPMPHLYPQFLSEAQVRDLAAYVQSL